MGGLCGAPRGASSAVGASSGRWRVRTERRRTGAGSASTPPSSRPSRRARRTARRSRNLKKWRSSDCSLRPMPSS
eukprot:180691-Prymnesium_polylepis.1